MDSSKKTGSQIRKVSIIGMFCALAFCVNAVVPRIPIVPAPFPLNYDAKDVIIVIGGFILGPISAFVIAAIASAVEMVTISTTGYWGFLMNVISSSAFACTAAFVYHTFKNKYSLFIGLFIAVITMTSVMLLWNYLIVPLYMANVTRSVAKGMLLSIFLPFNLIKSGLNAGLTLVLFKPLLSAVRRIWITEKNPRVSTVGVLLVGWFVIITCVLVSLMLMEVI